MVENHDAKDRDHKRKGTGQRKILRNDRPLPQNRIAEDLHRHRHRVNEKGGTHQSIPKGGQRINNRRYIHPKLHAKAHQQRQVSILGGQAGDNDAKAHAHEAKMHQHNRDQRPPGPVGGNVPPPKIIHQEKAYHDHLYPKSYHSAENVGDRFGQSRKIYLAEGNGIGSERICILGNAGGKKAPDRVAAHIKQDLRHAIRGDPRDPAKNQGVDHAGDKRVKEEPGRAKNGLLIGHLETAFREKDDQVPILPDFF